MASSWCYPSADRLQFASVIRIKDATNAHSEAWYEEGDLNRTPISIISPYRTRNQDWPAGSALIFSTTTLPSKPALFAMVRTGASKCLADDLGTYLLVTVNGLNSQITEEAAVCYHGNVPCQQPHGLPEVHPQCDVISLESSTSVARTNLDDFATPPASLPGIDFSRSSPEVNCFRTHHLMVDAVIDGFFLVPLPSTLVLSLVTLTNLARPSASLR